MKRCSGLAWILALAPMLACCAPASEDGEAATVTQPAPAAAGISDPRDYLRLHNTVGDPDGAGWGAALIALAVSGDAFTREHLAGLDRDVLDAQQTAQLDRAVATLRSRLRGNTSLRPDQVVARLERAAYADLMCDPMEATLPAWTRADIAAHLHDPEVRAEVERLAAGYTPTIEVTTMFSSLGERVPKYARDILETAAP